MMKMLLTISIALAAAWCYGMPSANTFAAVTNDWYTANFTNVYELAQQRMANNSNDVVAAYLIFDWDVCFSCLDSVSNSVTRVIRLSDAVTNSAFKSKYLSLRDTYISYRDELLPTVDEAVRISEQYKSYLPHKEMPSAYMLDVLNQAGLW